MFIIKSFEPGLWTIGTMSPEWEPFEDFSNNEQAANRCAFLNGIGNKVIEETQIKLVVDGLKDVIAEGIMEGFWKLRREGFNIAKQDPNYNL